MKKLLPTGAVLTFSQPARVVVNTRHDPWGSHAWSIGSVGASACASGQYAIHFWSILKGWNGWYYFLHFEPDYDSAVFFIGQWVTFAAPDGYVGAYGEWFNYAARAQVTDKMTFLQWQDFLLAN
jgi:hypothetical protein